MAFEFLERNCNDKITNVAGRERNVIFAREKCASSNPSTGFF
jgi:hypothetical protein